MKAPADSPRIRIVRWREALLLEMVSSMFCYTIWSGKNFNGCAANSIKQIP